MSWANILAELRPQRRFPKPHLRMINGFWCVFVGRQGLSPVLAGSDAGRLVRKYHERFITQEDARMARMYDQRHSAKKGNKP